MDRPETLFEWQALISQLAGPNLRSKAIAANSQQFAAMLLEDGYSMDDVAEIMQMLATQMFRTKMNPPSGGVWDLQGMADARHQLVAPDDEIERMIDNQPDDPPDNVDAAAEAANLDDAWGQEMETS